VYEFGGARNRKMSNRRLEKDTEGNGTEEAIFSRRESSEARAPTPCIIQQPLNLEGQTLRQQVTFVGRKVSRRGPVSRNFEDQARHALK
jgi:hypothetical protein